MSPRDSNPPRLEDLPELLTVGEYARWARRHRQGAYDDIHTGRVPHVRLGNSYRIPKAALVAILERATAPHSQGPARSTPGDQGGPVASAVSASPLA